MEALSEYRRAITELLREYAEHPLSHGDIQVELILDERQDHYELIYAGWSGDHRIHGSVVHIDIRDGKVIIQRDGTEDGVADRLAEAGIPKDRIVLAFKPPEIRPYTGFAVA
jgi:hypothetical protein